MPGLTSAWQFKNLLGKRTQKFLNSNFKSFSCLHTSGLQILLTMTWLQPNDTSLPSLQRNARRKRATEIFAQIPRHFKKLDCRFQWLLIENMNPQWWNDSIHVIATPRHLWFLCGAIVKWVEPTDDRKED